ncbi:GntR family transcriptional regulator [Terrarubrum flagellatum]|uniref:GntR family transcriptional regulator n=1 Tax=Terrirubrum flagellatum TaxID=2895980 RepID=UPI0031452026
MSKVVLATLAEQAYRELRLRILSGQLVGGRRLLPEELALELSISPTPIKEALLRLEADGLVVSPLRKGAVVRRFTIADVEELYEARMLIELNALDRLFRIGGVTAELLANMRRSLEQHALYASRHNLDDLTTALAHDREFHQQIMYAAGNLLISDWHQRILGQTHTVFVYVAGEYADSVDQHREVLDAMAAGSQEKSLEALRHHLARSREKTLSNVKRMQNTESVAP